MDIRQRLTELKDDEYADFCAKLTPGVERGEILGVRIPLSRKLAKEIFKCGEYNDFFNELPHKYYDEYILHVLLINEIKDYGECVKQIDKILPYVNNWAVCDIMSPKIFKKHRQELMDDILRWSKSNEVYTCRFGIEMLMSHFLDEDFKAEYLDIPAGIKSDEYYINMMIAWYLATALAKQWDATIPYIENGVTSKWVHNKTIQKARESYRISPQQKDYLKSLKK